MNEAKIKELFSNEEYVKSLFELGSYEKASKKLSEDGAEISADELKKVLELARKKAVGELSDEELENVAGGFEPLTYVILSVVVVAGASTAGALTSGC